MTAIKKFHLAFGMTALIKTLKMKPWGGGITDTKNFLHEIVSVRPLHKNGLVQNGEHMTNVVGIHENVECTASQSSPVAGFCEYGDGTWILNK